MKIPYVHIYTYIGKSVKTLYWSATLKLPAWIYSVSCH